MLEAAVEGAAAKAAGIIIANSCDAMRRLYDLWTQYVTTPPAFFLDVPKKADADAITFFASELRRLAERMERELPGTTVENDDLQGAIKACNEVRSLMEDVFRAQRCVKKTGLGTAVFDLCLAGTRESKDAFAGNISRFLADLTEDKGERKEQRILLTGSLINRRDLVAEIEDAGAQVVVLDTCIGLRHYQTAVEEGVPDAMSAVAKRYLIKPACGRMQSFEKRFQHMKGIAEGAAVDGIVFYSVKFCDSFLYDVPMMSSRFQELGIPSLCVEGDYTQADLEQTKTRIAAFLELLE
jgi:benzoyl-CoA reductase/2-hydroxyglutaryl-CoA dehydratase subunit BcrC/BadD/HgdB